MFARKIVNVGYEKPKSIQMLAQKKVTKEDSSSYPRSTTVFAKGNGKIHALILLPVAC